MRTVTVLVAVAVFAAALVWVLQQRQAEMAVLPEASPDDTAFAMTAAPTEAVTVEFTLAGLDGEARQFSEWSGRYRIVNFWATWCAPCRREIPLLKAFQDAHGADGFQVIGVAVESLEPVIAYAEAAQFNYPILAGEQDAMEAAASSGIPFVGLPFTMIVSRDSQLLGARMGEIHQQQLDDIVAVLTRLDRGEIDVAGARAALGML